MRTSHAHRIVFAIWALALCASSAHAALPAPKVLTIVAGQPFEPVPASGSSKLANTVCPEESEPATFTAKCAKPLPNVRIAAAGDLVGPGKIPRLSVEVHRVDGDNLVSSVSASTGAVYANADLGPTAVQFWVNVTVPRRTPPGNYKGSIAFYYQNKLFDSVPIEVQVLDLRLTGSSKQYLIYTSFGPGMDAEQFGEFLAAFQKIGFRAVSVSADPCGLRDAISSYVSAGMSSPVPLLTYAFGTCVPAVEDVKSLADAGSAAGVGSMLFFAADLPVTAEQITAAQAQLAVFTQARVKRAVRVSDETAAETLKPGLDGICYHVAMPYVQSLVSGEKTRTSTKWEWLWWDARSCAADNRFYAGIGLWKSGLDGCMPAWMPLEGKQPTDGSKSLLGEALREGMDDTRYLTSFMKALRELKDLKRERDKGLISAAETYVSSFLRKTEQELTCAALRSFRAKLADYSTKLESRL